MYPISYKFNSDQIYRLLNPVLYFRMEGPLPEHKLYLKQDLTPEIKYFIHTTKNIIEEGHSSTQAVSLATLCKTKISIDDFISVGSYIQNNPSSFKKDMDRILTIGTRIKNNHNLFQELSYWKHGQKSPNLVDFYGREKKYYTFIHILNLFNRLVLLKNFIFIHPSIFVDILHILFDVMFQSDTIERIKKYKLFLMRYLWQFLRSAGLEETTKKLIAFKLKEVGHLTEKQIKPMFEEPSKLAPQPYPLLRYFLDMLELEAQELGCFDFYRFFMDCVIECITQICVKQGFIQNLNREPQVSDLLYKDKKFEQAFRSSGTLYDINSLLLIVYKQHISYLNNPKSLPQGQAFYRDAVGSIDRALNIKSTKWTGFPAYDQTSGSCWLVAMAKIQTYLEMENLTAVEKTPEDHKLEKGLEHFIDNLNTPPAIKKNLKETWIKNKGGNVCDWLFQPAMMSSITPNSIYHALQTYGPLWAAGDFAYYAKKRPDEVTSHAVCIIGIIHNWFIAVSDSNDATYVEHIFPFDHFFKLLHKKGHKYLSGFCVKHPFWYSKQALYKYNIPNKV